MKLRYTSIELQLRRTFRIAHGASDTRRNLLLRLDEGWGEAAPVAYHGEDAEFVAAFLEHHRHVIEALSDPSAIVWLMRRLDGSQAGRAAVDMALHDALGRRLGTPVRALLGLSILAHAPTSFTLPIASPDELAVQAQAAAAYPILKVKLGGSDDLQALRIIREHAPSARLRVDANGGWTVEQGLALLPVLADMGVELVEQPLPKGEIEGLRQLRRAAHGLPIIADESVRVARDIPPLAGAVDGVNIKLQKAGGIIEALAAIQTARAHDMRVMLGCMIESSLGVAAALALAPLADDLDLDGPLLIANDPFSGIVFEGAVLVPPQAPGLGVQPSVSLTDLIP
ncbi:MAG: muconate cycloisomerase [Herpetosiphonaceae bacterium]|nr:MAG: muconate cycloisomerase [Herpetosiphonaceae bacterium]